MPKRRNNLSPKQWVANEYFISYCFDNYYLILKIWSAQAGCDELAGGFEPIRNDEKCLMNND